jgi:hypothetical protein
LQDQPAERAGAEARRRPAAEVLGADDHRRARLHGGRQAVQYLAADQGLGYLITMGRRLAMPSMVLLGMICVGLTGVAIGIVIEKVEKRLLAGVRR